MLEELNKINNKLQEIKKEKRKNDEDIAKLIKERDEVCSKLLEILVGKFFENEKGVFFVYSVPLPFNGLAFSSPNFYQIPIYFFNFNEKELNKETIYSRACQSEQPLTTFIEEGNKPITKKQFFAKIYSIMDELFTHAELFQEMGNNF